ncbi:MAG: F-actin-capping protein subunit alpha [Caeruleum heppii]|nr:MAG: F-actin-capping protein subunit alpha [Caeruleum heppii]
MSQTDITSRFIEGAPPGELNNVVADIQALLPTTPSNPSLLPSLRPAFAKYDDEQFTTVTLPGVEGREVIVSKYNKLGDGKLGEGGKEEEGEGRYVDVTSGRAFGWDYVGRKVTDMQDYKMETKWDDLIPSLQTDLTSYTTEHYSSATTGVYPTDNDKTIAILIVANKYSPANYWNGRYRSSYLLTPSPTTPSASTLTGTIAVDIHYYEDGNVRLTTKKTLSIPLSSAASCTFSADTPNPITPSAFEIIRNIAQAEKRYQEELNRAFASLSEGAFKALRRQLPVTRQKVEWEKIGGYKLGQDLGGAGRR